MNTSTDTPCAIEQAQATELMGPGFFLHLIQIRWSWDDDLRKWYDLALMIHGASMLLHVNTELYEELLFLRDISDIRAEELMFMIAKTNPSEEVHIICCNDALECAVIGSEGYTEKVLEELAMARYREQYAWADTYETYRQRLYWHIHSLPINYEGKTK